MDSKKGGLGEKETQLLQRHWKTLKQDIRMSDIVDNLIVEGILKPAQWEELKRKYNIEKERTEEFLLMLQRKPNKSFVSFREALRENGYDHLAEKLEFKDDRPPKKSHNSPEMSAAATAEIMKTLKELRENDTQRQKELDTIRQEQEKSSQKLEKKLASNLKQTNDELNKLKESLRHKEEEIEKLKEIQRQHEESNRSLTEENKKLEKEKEQMVSKLKLKTSEREEMELRMQKHKLNEERIAREKEKLKKTVERQSVQLEQEVLNKNKAIDNLQRERTAVELMKRENTELKERIEKLEDENETLSARPYTAMTCRDLDNMDSHSLISYRRQPTGLSGNGENTSMGQLLDQRREIEEEIKRKQIEQKYLKKRLRELNSMEPGAVDSQVCVIQ